MIGKVREFQRIATAKMTHPSIKIDTSVHTIKRGLPENNDAGLDVLGDQDNPKLEAGNTENVPPFLCQSVSGECCGCIMSHPGGERHLARGDNRD